MQWCPAVSLQYRTRYIYLNPEFKTIRISARMYIRDQSWTILIGVLMSWIPLTQILSSSQQWCRECHQMSQLINGIVFLPFWFPEIYSRYNRGLLTLWEILSRILAHWLKREEVNVTGQGPFMNCPVYIGMKVMVTENIEIDLDLINGAWGEIVDIVLHPDEPPIGDAPMARGHTDQN